MCTVTTFVLLSIYLFYYLLFAVLKCELSVRT